MAHALVPTQAPGGVGVLVAVLEVDAAISPRQSGLLGGYRKLIHDSVIGLAGTAPGSTSSAARPCRPHHEVEGKPVPRLVPICSYLLVGIRGEGWSLMDVELFAVWRRLTGCGSGRESRTGDVGQLKVSTIARLVLSDGFGEEL